MKYRKKPIVIEVEQFDEINKPFPKGICRCLQSRDPHVHTIHNNQIVNITFGDWIIPEPDGKHFYPVKPDIFEQTYEPVEEI